MREQAIHDSVAVAPGNPPLTPERIPTTEDLIYGETLYLKVGGAAERWLTGGRGDGQTSVYTRDGEGGAEEAGYRWTVMKSRTVIGSGVVRYGDIIYLKVGGAAERWLTGGRGDGQTGVFTRDGEGGKEEDTYRWTVMQSRTTTGTGAVKRGDAVYLKVGGGKDRWLTGGRGDGQTGVFTRDGEGGKEEDTYRWTSSPVSYSRVFAIFAEDSPETKAMSPRMNTRVFTRVEARSPDASIGLDLATGIITLPPGTYHLTGFSAVAYLVGDEPTGMMTNKAPFANGSYCRLRHSEPADPEATPNEDAIAVGSISTTNAIPSLIDGWFTTTEEARILLEHQAGDTEEMMKNVVLRSNPNHSRWHFFARLAIERV